MMGWENEPLLGFDLETTGTDPEEARIVQYAFSWWDQGEHVSTASYPVNPGVPIPDEAAAIHGFTDERVRAAMTHDQALDRIVAQLIDAVTQGVVLVGMNLAYDLTIVARRWTEMVGIDTVGQHLPRVVDVLVLDKHFDKYRKGRRNLGALAEHYGVDAHDAHDAGADAAMSVGVFVAMLATFPELAATDPGALHDLQRSWAMDQTVSYDEYRRKMGQTPLDLPAEGTWPIRLRPGTSAEVA